ncbi:MAG: PilZ domain-containing protein [Deltaproteobacteria bacterium]|nr:PilZ domain-containing protein [Deltaproteobacteria bacterium]
MGAERRQFERRTLKTEIYCYLEGRRVDVRSSDISAGGMFIETDLTILPGSELAVVVKAQLLDGERPVFLAARVMRRQLRPCPGIGVRWERAATPGSEETLREFLRTLLGIDPRGIRQIPQGDAGLVQSVYSFPLGPGEEPPEDGIPPLAGGNEDTIDGLNDEEETAQEVAADVKEELQALRSTAGPLTGEIQAASQARADHKAILEARRQEHPVRISSLGLTNAFVLTQTELESREVVDLRFSVPVRDGTARIVCRCEVLSTGRDPASGRRGALLKLVRVDEGEHPGILRQFIRWLHFRSLRGGAAQ